MVLYVENSQNLILSSTESINCFSSVLRSNRRIPDTALDRGAVGWEWIGKDPLMPGVYRIL